eukprot:CAMPEP_0203845644 /NCGR_PEP_ID=MMETSP0359-20131031/3934_1 /ASSEMBLY_ACC=CAM_ASM_000338 /TAXON_ID=268821 /ORGANISM="Scrippsiella Hangoei, Strain SHTV-5" /LENGTH=193 /DNA_ID=CAMNT_0050760813 /DNA_START=12 /DNA_END=593 /DNA_ORIENTATION=+
MTPNSFVVSSDEDCTHIPQQDPHPQAMQLAPMTPNSFVVSSDEDCFNMNFCTACHVAVGAGQQEDLDKLESATPSTESGPGSPFQATSDDSCTGSGREAGDDESSECGTHRHRRREFLRRRSRAAPRPAVAALQRRAAAARVREEVALKDVCKRIAHVFRDERDDEDTALRDVCKRIASVFRDAEESDFAGAW